MDGEVSAEVGMHSETECCSTVLCLTLFRFRALVRRQWKPYIQMSTRASISEVNSVMEQVRRCHPRNHTDVMYSRSFQCFVMHCWSYCGPSLHEGHRRGTSPGAEHLEICRFDW
jgi:hypothetical protein